MTDLSLVTVDLPFPDPKFHTSSGVIAAPERTLYPPIKPYAGGLLDVGDDQQIYWEECGNPHGKPVVFLHGGPGGGGGTDRRRFFDPQAYRIIVFDQRGCGKSMPHAADDSDLSANTTWQLVDDIEQLRSARGITRWQVFGGSWGSTLALAYAETHPERVSELVLRGIYTLRRKELDFYYNYGASEIFPEWWKVFCAPLERSGHDFSRDNIAAYHDLLFSDDPEVYLPAAIAWTTWESATSSLLFNQEHVEESADPRSAVAFARIENHYFVHGGWLGDEQLLADAGRLRTIPTTIVQGRYDMPCAATTALELHERLPNSELKLVIAGHSAFEPAIASELVKATDKYARATIPTPMPVTQMAAPREEVAWGPLAEAPDSDDAGVEPSADMDSTGLAPATKRDFVRYLGKVQFSIGKRGTGYHTAPVDEFIDRVLDEVKANRSPLQIIMSARFLLATDEVEGYAVGEVDDFVDLLERVARGEPFIDPGRRKMRRDPSKPWRKF